MKCTGRGLVQPIMGQVLAGATHMSARPILSEAWEEVLKHVQLALHEAEAAATAREEALAPLPQDDAGNSAFIGRREQCLQRLEERVQAWQARMQRAAQQAREADDNLNAGEQALRQWLAESKLMEQRLVNWA